MKFNLATKSMILILSVMISKVSFAGPVDDIKAAVGSTCKKELATSEALKLVMSLTKNCEPNSDVDVDGCKVKCLKSNDGAVVGK